MNTRRWTTTAALVASLAVLTAGTAAIADERGVEVSVMGGVHVLNENDTALPDKLVNIPAVGTLTYRLTPILAVEGEFTWMIPVEQSVSMGGVTQDLKTPDILAYQGNLRATWPMPGGSWSPYLAGGAGAITFLSNTDSNRRPALQDSETMFALNFGGGLTYGLTQAWSLRADFRELVAFPSDDAAGLSNTSGADEIWMERGTVGLAYRF